MEIQYRSVLKENKVKLTDEIIDPAFRTKAEDLEKKLAANALSDDEIKAADDELVKLFYELHNVSEEDSEELQREKLKSRTLEGKNKIAEAETIEEINALAKEYEDCPDLQTFIEKRKEKLQKASQAAERTKFVTEATEEIKTAEYKNLQSLLTKYKDEPDLLKLVQQRIEKDKPADPPASKRDLLSKAHKREWSYDDLRKIGIEPTGDDMEIDGVYLQRQYMLKIYKIYSVDGKRI